MSEISLKKVLFIESWNCSPHLETSLEIAKQHADAGDIVYYYFCGHDTPYREGISLSAEDAGWLTLLPEVRGVRLINSKNIEFKGRCRLPKVRYARPDDFSDIKQLMDFRYKDLDAGLAVASSLISNTRNSDPDPRLFRAEVDAMLDSAIRVYEFSLDAIKTHKPDIVYVFNGRFCNHRPVMQAAIDLGVKSLFHERGATMHQYDITEQMPHDPVPMIDKISKHWAAADREASTKIAHQFFNQRRYAQASDLASLRVHQRNNHLPAIDSAKRVVTYFSSSDDEYAAVGEIFKWVGFKNQLDAVKHLIEICNERGDIQLFVRLHPYLREKSTEDQLRWLALKDERGVNLISFDSAVDSYALMDRSDVVITSGSWTSMEAVYWGRPAITLGPVYFADLGAGYKAESPRELRELLLNTKLKSDPDKALPFAYYFATFGTQYLYYHPTSMTSGDFLGVNLQDKSMLWHRARHYRSKLSKILPQGLSGRKRSVSDSFET